METKKCEQLLGQINLRLESLISGYRGVMLKSDIDKIINEIRKLIARYKKQDCLLDEIDATINPIVKIIDDWNNKRI